MPLIDGRGRLFGKVNLIDAVIGLFVLVMIPLGYGAYLLFRVPVPTIVSIEPKQIAENTAATLKIVGQDLRPFLRARFGPFESAGFLIQSPTLAEIKVPPTLAAGTYDLTVYDEGRELVRIPGAVAVVPAGSLALSIALEVSGTFVGLSNDDVSLVRIGMKFAEETEVVSVGAPETLIRRVRVASNRIVMVPMDGHLQVPAVLRIRCQLTDETCKLGATVLELNKTISLSAPSNETQRRSEPLPAELWFFVTEVRTAP
jgi:hypothetical protein